MSSSLERLKASHGVTIQWRSFELRPQGAPPMPEHYKQKILAAFPQFQQMAKERYGLDIIRGEMGINSRLALRGAKYAESVGQGDAYHDAMFRAYWQEARSIDQTDAVADIAESLGINRQAMLDALVNPIWDTQVTEDVALAHQLEISGVPALLFNQKYFISGAQPYEELVRVVEYIRTREDTE